MYKLYKSFKIYLDFGEYEIYNKTLISNYFYKNFPIQPRNHNFFIVNFF